jgi:hypothetical protein
MRERSGRWAACATLYHLALLLPAVVGSASSNGKDRVSRSTEVGLMESECPSKTINYITHSLPQQCLRTSWSPPNSSSTAIDTATVATPTVNAQGNGVSISTGGNRAENVVEEKTITPQPAEEEEDLAASHFMSFEEWKEMMFRKQAEEKARKHKDEVPIANTEHENAQEGGEASSELDALAEKLSDITSQKTTIDTPAPEAKEAVETDPIVYEDGQKQYRRSKDAGTTSKERFSYASFDAGATVKKTSPGAKNAKALLAENKDTYMLLECATPNKFVIIELSDDILVDTVVLANFEFFSSMFRRFRVSVSDRYPVKMDKWVELGTFEARNSRDVQPFLIEHPQIYTKYLRIEFLSHFGNEYYCPVSLLRVHGTRMLDSWKETEEETETLDAPEPEVVATSVLPETTVIETAVVLTEAPAMETQSSSPPSEVESSPWPAMFNVSWADTCEQQQHMSGKRVAENEDDRLKVDSASASGLVRPQAISEGQPSSTSDGKKVEPASAESRLPTMPVAVAPTETANATVMMPSVNAVPAPAADTATSHKVAKSDQSAPPKVSLVQVATPSTKNKTATSSSANASPTVQDSFFKAVNKRLQNLESNTTLSLQYIESQSRVLQETLSKIERKQVARVDTFLDALNNTALTELRSLRTQYDQIWQSTVLALEAQRETAQREVVALSTRLGVLADEVVFQKRMAILQSVLLLACMVLVIFSRGIAGSGYGGDWAYPQGQRESWMSPARSMSSGLGGFSSSPSPVKHGGASTRISGSPLRRAPAGDSPDRVRTFSRTESYNDKLLPLTPTSVEDEEGHAVGPTVRVEFEGVSAVGEDTMAMRTAPAAMGSTELEDKDETSQEVTPESADGERKETADIPAAGLEPSTDIIAASALESVLGTERKPLPALPEDPS